MFKLLLIGALMIFAGLVLVIAIQAVMLWRADRETAGLLRKVKKGGPNAGTN